MLHFADRSPVRLRIKLEGRNPLGSIKDRAAAAMLRALDEAGRLTPDARVIESSSGNLAVALAGRCRALGVGFIAVVDPKITAENLQRLRELGADIDMVETRDETGGYLLTRLRRIEARLKDEPQLVWTDQYHNPVNPQAHYESTGPELLDQVGSAVDAVFVAVSTGGTFAGMSRCFQERAPSVALVAVDVEGSLALGLGGPAERHLSGIGASQPSRFVDPNQPLHALSLPEGEAVAVCGWLREVADLHLGASSGAAVAGALRWLEAHPEATDVVCLSPDFGNRYESTVYNPAWRARWGFHAPFASPIRIQPIDPEEGPLG